MLKHGHLSSAAEQGHSHMQLVGAEAITLARCGEAESLKVGDVAVSVQDATLSVAELGTGSQQALQRSLTGASPNATAAGE